MLTEIGRIRIRFRHSIVKLEKICAAFFVIVNLARRIRFVKFDRFCRILIRFQFALCASRREDEIVL